MSTKVVWRMTLFMCVGIIVQTYSNAGPRFYESRASKPQSNAFRLESTLIRRVAREHPRLAATLANQNVFGFHRGIFTIHWTPVPLDPSDIEKFLNRKQYEKYFSGEYREQVIRINEKMAKGAEIQYRMIVDSPEPETIIIDVAITKGSPVDPAGDGLEMKISGVRVDTDFLATCENTKWSIKPGKARP